MPPTETITATVQRAKSVSVWLYRKPDTGWCILKTNKGTFKGTVSFEPSEGDVLQFEGYWQASKFNGKQEFVFRTALLSVPEEPRALLHLAVTWTKGLGEAKESTIWDVYGADWINATELSKIGGISGDTRWNWNDTLKRIEHEKAQAQAVSFLMAKGCSLNMASAAWERWKADTVSKVSQNCYRLADLPHYGFTHVDNAIRVAFNVGDDDPRRVDAAILYAHEQIIGQGNTVSEWGELVFAVRDLVPLKIDTFEDRLNGLVEAGMVKVLDDKTGLSNAVCLVADWEDELKVWNRFAKR